MTAVLLVAGFHLPLRAQGLPAPLMTCVSEPDDTRRLKCFDEAVARMRRASGEPTPTPPGASVAAAAASGAAPAVTSAAAGAGAASPATAPPPGTPRMVHPEEEFGLRGDLKAEKTGALSELVSTVREVRAKPYGELVVTLANQQVWAEIAPSKIKLKPGDTVKIEAGALRSFILVAPNGRSSKVTRVR
jgi:hypothetical protein